MFGVDAKVSVSSQDCRETGHCCSETMRRAWWLLVRLSAHGTPSEGCEEFR